LANWRDQHASPRSPQVFALGGLFVFMNALDRPLAGRTSIGDGELYQRKLQLEHFAYPGQVRYRM